MNHLLDHRLAPLSITRDQRDRPDPAFIEQMRARYDVEREMDLMLTRKLQRRAAPPYAGADLVTMTGHLRRFLEAHVEGPFELGGQRWFAGGASKIQMGFTLEWTAPGRGRVLDRLMVRMEPSESVNSTSRSREFELLQAFEGHVPVPKPYWVDADGHWFPEPALIYAFCDGVTKPTATTSGRFAGIGTAFGPELRARLAPQFAEQLAAIHRFDFSSHVLPAFDRPEVGTTHSARQQLDRARRIWEEDRNEDLPLVEVAANWLERNLPVLDRLSVVHGDYRSGNFLFDETSGRITAVLDWERGYLGDRHRDLAWTTNRAFGCLAEDGSTFLASGLAPLDEFFELYERHAGLRVDPQRLRYYTIFNSYQLVVAAIATAAQVVRLGKTHQDILLASVEPVGLLAAEELRRTLEELL